jgi:hypothetical protein
LKARGDRAHSADQIIEDLRDKLGEAAPDTEIEFVQLLQDMLGDLEGNPDPIEIKIFGEDSNQLAEIAEELQPKIEEISGIVDVVGPTRGAPEITWKVDPLAAGRLGLSIEQVAGQLSDAWAGSVATDSASCRSNDPGARALSRRLQIQRRAPRGHAGARRHRHARAGVIARDDLARERPGRAVAGEPAADGADHGATREPRPGKRRGRHREAARGHEAAARLHV